MNRRKCCGSVVHSIWRARSKPWPCDAILKKSKLRNVSCCQLRRPKKNPATAGYWGVVRAVAGVRRNSLVGLYGVLIMRHGTPLGPVANLAFELLPVGYIANLDPNEPHRHIASRTAWMD
jgi:hypothetical protein